MNYLKFIGKECILIDEKADSKGNILKKLASLAKKSPLLDNNTEEDIFKAFMDRENISSTGFAKGIAIPHCKLKNVSDFVIGILTVPEGCDYESLDGKKTKLFVFIIAPEHLRNEHIHILSSISKSFRTVDEINEVVALKNNDDLLKFFEEKNNAQNKNLDIIEFSKIEVYIQDEEKFLDVLEIFADIDNCSISITEANDCGFYLHSVPLFAFFWNESQKQSHQVISATINKALANDLIRKIQTHTGDINKNSGVMILLHDLAFKAGDLNL